MEWQKGTGNHKASNNKQPEGHMMLAQLAEKEYYNKKNKQELYLKLSKLRYKSTLEDVTQS